MGHRGERSEESKAKRAVRDILLDAAFNDRVIKEIVSQTTSDQLLKRLNELYPDLAAGVSLVLLDETCAGLVLIDSYGRGAFQYAEANDLEEFQ